MNTKTDTTGTTANPWMEGVTFVGGSNQDKAVRIALALGRVTWTLAKILFSVLAVCTIALLSAMAENDEKEVPPNDVNNPFRDPYDPYRDVQ